MSDDRYKALIECDDSEIKSQFHQMHDSEKQSFFTFNIVRANTDIVLMLMDEGMQMKDSDMNLDTPAARKNCFRFFKALHERGVDVRQRGDILMFKACLNRGTPSLDTIMFLGNLITEQDSRSAYLSFTNIMTQNLQDKNNDGTLTKKCEEMMEYLATKLSPEKMRESADLLDKYSKACPQNYAFLSKKARYLALNKEIEATLANDVSGNHAELSEKENAVKMKI